MPFKAILFDLDGTLLDTLEDIGNAMNRVLQKYGFPVYDIDAYRHLVGEGVTTLAARVLPEGKKSEDLIRTLVRAYREDYGNNWRVKTKPYDGITEMLDALTARGFKMAVLSNKPDEFTKLCVNAFLSKWTFDIVLGQRSSVPPKPDPAGAKEVAEGLKISPSQFLYLGDTAIDMKTAVSAGMFPVGVLWGFRAAEELCNGGAQALIKKPQDVLNLLGNG
jgi:phosphoglycolate phosphatase